MNENVKQKIEELIIQLASLKAERDQLNNEAKNWAEKRNILNEKIKKLRAEANSTKEKRDALNQEVKRLKTLREQAKAGQKEKCKQISKLKEKIKLLWKKKPSRNLHAIQKEIENLEWKIQTTPLEVKQEEELISKIKHLEIQRNILKQLQELKDRLIKLQTEEKALSTKAKFHHEKLSKIAEQSQKLHEQRLETLNQIQKFKIDADNAHQKYVEIKQRANQMHQKYKEMLQKINDLKRKQRREEEAKQAKRQKQLLEETRKKALEKMKRGEKLTWEEFKLLAEQGNL